MTATIDWWDDIPTINWEVANKAIEAIEQNPELFDMNDWAFKPRSGCGTKLCFAGWVCVTQGDELYFTPGSVSTSRVKTPEGEYRSIDGRAMQHLGIGLYDASELFYRSEIYTADDLRRALTIRFGSGE